MRIDIIIEVVSIYSVSRNITELSPGFYIEKKGWIKYTVDIKHREAIL